MRFKNSYAAAVAAAVSAVVFSAAFQPASAGPVTIPIDTFANATSPNPLSGANFTDNDSVPLLNVYGPNAGLASGSFSALSPRQIAAYNAQNNYAGGSAGFTAALATQQFYTANGSLTSTATLGSIGDGTPYPRCLLRQELAYGYSYTSSADFNIPTYFGLRISSLPGSLRTAPANMSWYITLDTAYDPNDPAGDNQFTYFATAADIEAFFNGGDLDIPFNSFFDANNGGVSNPSPVNLGEVYGLSLSWNDPTPPGNGASTEAFALTGIALVPEPTQMVSVAGIGAAYGAWRLRKLRRSRTAAGEAIAG